ncbi:MAG: GerAB/ArcD/ProY family transporter [archaeon]|nr:MAG: GerAB/ArcD/ProY family transporter [archaeon]
MKKRGALLAAIGTLTGTIVGAGILGIPYVVSKSGLLPGLIVIGVLASLVLMTNLYFGEVMLRTKGKHQLPGYIGKYLGKKGKIIMLISSLIFIYGALTAYLLGEGEVLSFIFTGGIGSTILFSFLFFIALAYLIYVGLEALEKGEVWGSLAVIGMVLLIFIFFIKDVAISNFTLASSNPVMWFLPYGVVLFAFLATSCLPEMREELEKNEKLLKKAIIIGSLIPIVLYVLFTIAVYGFAGANTPQIATIALGKLPSILAVFTMFTSFLALGIALKEVFMYDFKMSHDKSYLLVIIPLFLIAGSVILFRLASFVRILSLVGSLAGGIAGVLILLTIKKAKKVGERKPEYVMPINWIIISLLILMFIAGIVYQFIF